MMYDLNSSRRTYKNVQAVKQIFDDIQFGSSKNIFARFKDTDVLFL